MTKPRTNIEIIVDLMQYSKHGALAQCFIVHAIREAAEKASQQIDPETGAAWQQIAIEIKQRMDDFYETR